MHYDISEHEAELIERCRDRVVLLHWSDRLLDHIHITAACRKRLIEAAGAKRRGEGTEACTAALRAAVQPASPARAEGDAGGQGERQHG